MPVIVKIIYWVKDLLGKIFSDKIEVIGHETLERSGCFEIEVGEDKTLVHSKKRGDGFVDSQEKELKLARAIGKIIGVEVSQSMLLAARGMDGSADLLLIDLDKHLSSFRKGKLSFVKKPTAKDATVSSSGSQPKAADSSNSSDDEEISSFQPRSITPSTSPSTSPKRPFFKKSYAPELRGEPSGYTKKFTTPKKQPDLKKNLTPILPSIPSPSVTPAPLSAVPSVKSIGSVASSITAVSDDRKSNTTLDESKPARSLNPVDEETAKTPTQDENNKTEG